jgi:hypothetical protein
MHRQTVRAPRRTSGSQAVGRPHAGRLSCGIFSTCARFTALAALATLAACEGDDGSAPGGPGGSGGSNPPLPAAPEVGQPHACGLRVSELSVYQGVKVALLREGEAVTPRNLPIVVGRRAYFRALLAYSGAPTAGTAVVRLRLESSAGVQEFESRGLVTDPSSDPVLESSLNFDVPGDAIRADTRVTVDLYIGSTCANGGKISYPASGGLALSAEDTGVLKVVLVPIQYNADGSGRLPNLSEAQLQRYRDHLLAVYPTRAVELIVHEPLMTAVELTNESGWPQMLETLREVRARDGAAADHYYYGLVEPAESFTTYCRNACVAGLSYLVESLSGTRLVGLGVGFATGSVAGETLVHELGHQHGRTHTPCGGGANQDRNYPHMGGGIGEWGLDTRTVPPRLQSPSNRKDMMGYCNPQWISDYTYGGIAQRRSAVSSMVTAARVLSGLPGTTEPVDLYRTLLADGAGRVSWGRPLTGETAPAGHPERAQVLDAAGVVIDEVTVYRTGYGHGTGASYDVPRPRAGWAALAIAGLPPIDFHAPAMAPARTRLLEPVLGH